MQRLRTLRTQPQKAFAKYGLDKFKFCVYEGVAFIYESKIVSSKDLTDLETSFMAAP